MKSFPTRSLITLIALVGFFMPLTAFPSTANAQAEKTIQDVKLKNYLIVDNLQALITATVPNFLLGIVGAIAVIFFLINALKYLTSAGNSEGTGEAKMGMLAGIIGIVIALGALIVISTVNSLIGKP